MTADIMTNYCVQMERQVADLKDEIAQVQEQERSMAERAIQAVVSSVIFRMCFSLYFYQLSDL
jgi:hypothetical protein